MGLLDLPLYRVVKLRGYQVWRVQVWREAGWFHGAGWKVVKYLDCGWGDCSWEKDFKTRAEAYRHVEMLERQDREAYERKHDHWDKD